MNKLTMIAFAGLTAVVCANAQAAGASDLPSVTVRYSTSELTSDASIARVYQRINAAAGRVCGERLAPGSPFVSRGWRLCVQGATHDALVQIKSPAVATYAAASR